MKSALLLSLVLTLGASLVTTLPAAATNDTSSAAQQPANEPTTLADLDNWYIQPATNQNATPLYLAAFAAITETNPAAPIFLVANQKARGLLHQAATRSQCRYPIDLKQGFNAKLPHLFKIKLSTQLLQQEAHQNAAKGQMNLATHSLLAGLAVARSVEAEPLVISQLVRMRGLELTVTGLELALNRRSFSEDQMTQLSAALQTAEAQDETANVRALIGERCAGLAAFQTPKQLATLVQRTEEAPVNMSPEVSQVLAKHERSPKMQEDFVFYSNRLENIITTTKSPFPDKVAEAKVWGMSLAEARAKDYLYSAMLLPALEKFILRSAATVAELRVAQTALAIERYRWANRQQLPDSLTQLMPQYLTAIPSDPFDGQPLRYKKNSGKGFTVYSIGPDQQDDQGTHKPAKIYSGLRYDLALTVAR